MPVSERAASNLRSKMLDVRIMFHKLNIAFRGTGCMGLDGACRASLPNAWLPMQCYHRETWVMAITESEGGRCAERIQL